MAENLSWDLTEIKKDVFVANRECSQRGLLQSAKWAAEMCYALDQVSLNNKPPQTHESQDFLNEVDCYNLAKSYFDLKEYDRAAHFVEHCTSQKAYFLHMYSRYLSGEKKQLDDAADSSGEEDSAGSQHLKTLRTELHKRHRAGQLDGYLLYLYGVVLKKLDLLKEATEILVDAIKKEPLHWASWLELSLSITDKDMLKTLALPDHWMRHLFNAHTSLELQLNQEALKMYQTLSDSGLSRSTYIMSQISMAYHNLREVDLAVESYAKLQKVDPYRLEDMDTYSNLLYVKEMRADLAYLAHHCCDIDKYRVQTCCVIGNYYSLRSEHAKAVLYFQRALKLNPNYLSAWTLMGHEYMELKNTPAAIQAYRKAIEVNKRDYRAWYGLGQTYEILKMPFYCLYYYRQAQVLRPNDSRMIVALGEAYEKLERLQEAKKCYWKAHSIGDMEGSALIKLGRLYERLNEEDQAAAAYTEYINETDMQGVQMSDDVSMLSNAYKYLANFHLKYDHVEQAYLAAQKCTEFSETREEGKALLRQISQLRALGSDPLHSGAGSTQHTADVRQTAECEGTTPATVAATQQQQDNTTPQMRLFPMNLTFTP